MTGAAAPDSHPAEISRGRIANVTSFLGLCFSIFHINQAGVLLLLPHRCYHCRYCHRRDCCCCCSALWLLICGTAQHGLCTKFGPCRSSSSATTRFGDWQWKYLLCPSWVCGVLCSTFAHCMHARTIMAAAATITTSTTTTTAAVELQHWWCLRIIWKDISLERHPN